MVINSRFPLNELIGDLKIALKRNKEVKLRKKPEVDADKWIYNKDYMRVSLSPKVKAKLSNITSKINF